MRPNDTIRRLLRRFLPGCFALLLLTGSAFAQQQQTPSLTPEEIEDLYPPFRANGTWFVRGLIGADFYGGDRDINVLNEFQKFVENWGIPVYSLEGGYSFTNRFSLSMQYFYGRYPRIKDDIGEDGPFDRPAYGPIDAATTSTVRHHFALVGRSYILPNRRVTPYGHLGIHLSFGKINDDIRTAVGPMAGLGFDTYVSQRLGIFFEIDGIFAFNDRALDLADTRSKQLPNTEQGIDASDFDAFTFIGVGLRYNFSGLPGPPLNVECGGPMTSMTLIPDEVGTFTATVNEDAARPITYSWDYGDGTVESGGLLMNHAFSSPGEYIVTVTASNKDYSDQAQCPVVVLEPPACQVSATPTTLSMCSQPLPPCRFQSEVSGSAPFTYSWNFGDGGTSTQAEPSHTYVRIDAEPTTLTRIATLTVSNPAGSAQCSVPINIEPCPCDPNLVFAQVSFNRNESVILDQGRRNLQDNLAILLANPSTIVVVEGFAQPNEANAQGLADDRARAVAQYYSDNGIDASRISPIGLIELVGGKSGPINTRTMPFCNEAERDAYIQQQQGVYR